MMAMRVNIGALKNDLSQYLHKVRDGEEITITDRNEPIAKIISLERPLVKADFKMWFKDHPPIKATKKQPSSVELLRQVRDEE